MNEILRNKILSNARALWDAGRAAEAGCEIFERIPRTHRPVWAADILQLVHKQTHPHPQVENVLDFAHHPEKWKQRGRLEAHGVVDAAGQLRGEPLPEDSLSQPVLELARNVAKVVFNAYGFPAPYDHHAGWAIAVDLRSIVEQFGDADLSMRAWSTLGRVECIQLEFPTVCHPACPCSIVYQQINNDVGAPTFDEWIPAIKAAYPRLFNN